ncbi:MAG: hypothetical protein HQK84_02190 [Nitrospinae bacterium]|nr:hypothetical protein [Nitrospinota bacterium]
MKKTTILLFAFVFSLSLFFGKITSAEESKPFTIGTDQGFYSDYTWRGTYINKSAWQGDVYITLLDSLTFNVWYNMPTQNDNANKSSFTEVDYTIDYAFSYEGWSFDIGHITFDFPKTPAGSISTTNEAFLTIGYDTMLSPTLGIYYDYDKTDGIYFQFDVSHSEEISDWATLNFGITQGYAVDEGPDTGKNTSGTQYFQYYDKNSGFTSTELSAGIDISLGHFSPSLSHATLSANGLYIIRTTGMVLGASAGAPSYGRDEFVTSINLNFEF